MQPVTVVPVTVTTAPTEPDGKFVLGFSDELHVTVVPLSVQDVIDALLPWQVEGHPVSEELPQKWTALVTLS